MRGGSGGVERSVGGMSVGFSYSVRGSLLTGRVLIEIIAIGVKFRLFFCLVLILR